MVKKVLVVMGGFSSEREVSLISGQGVFEALKTLSYDVIAYDLTDVNDFIDTLRREKPDVVFNALHGNFGEDGTIQGFLDLMQIPYTHSGLKASAIGMDKDLTKEIAQRVGVKVAKSEKMTVREFFSQGTTIPMPYVLKPVSDGSSVGVYIVHNEDDLKRVAYMDDNLDVLVEQYIEGREFTAMVLEGKSYVVTELVTKLEFYDYQAKYTNGMTEHVLPAKVEPDVAATCLRYAEDVHFALGCNMISRSDFRYNPQDGVVFLEINTNPGLTPLSLVPEQAKYVGISYEQLCHKLVESAACHKM